MIGIIADVHLHPHKSFATIDENGFNSRVEEALFTLQQVVDECSHRGVAHLYIAGDLFHVGKRTDVTFFNHVRFSLRRIFSTLKRVTIIEGNHDRVDKLIPGKSILHMLHIDNVNIVSNLGVFHEDFDDIPGGYNVVVAPYTENSEALERGVKLCIDELSPVDRLRTTIMIGHLAVGGAKTDRFEYQPAVETNAGMLIQDPVIQFVFLGHYHRHQMLNSRMMYVGSPLTHDFGESGQDKGMVFVDFVDGQAVPEFFALHGSTKYDVITPEALEGDQSQYTYLNTIVRVDYTGALNERDVEEQLKKLGAKEVVFNNQPDTVQEERVTESAEGGEPSTAEYMQAYVDTHGSGMDPERLMAIGLKLVGDGS